VIGAGMGWWAFLKLGWCFAEGRERNEGWGGGRNG